MAAFIVYACKPKYLKLYMAAEDTKMANISSANIQEKILGTYVNNNNPADESREAQSMLNFILIRF